MSSVTPLIEQVRDRTEPYVIVTIDEEGIRWRPGLKSECEVIAAVLGNCAVMTREAFIEALIKSEQEDDA